MNGPLAEQWDSIERLFAPHREKLGAEFEAAWLELDRLLRRLQSAYDLSGWTGERPRELAQLSGLVEAWAAPLLLDTLRDYSKAKPLRRAIDALEESEAGNEDLLRSVPESILLSGRDLARFAAAHRQGRWRALYRWWLSDTRPYPLRALLKDHLLRESVRMGRLRGRFLLLLAKSSLVLIDPWLRIMDAALENLRGDRSAVPALERDRQSWLRRSERLRSQISRTLRLLEGERVRAPSRVAAALIGARSLRSGKRRGALRDEWQEYFGYWSRMQRAVDSLLDLHCDLAEMLSAAASFSRQSLESLGAEREGLLSEMDKVAGWLENWEASRASDLFPLPEVRLVSAQERAAEWLRGMSEMARTHLPPSIETLEPRAALPGLFSPWRRLQTQDSLVRSLKEFAGPAVLQGFQEAESAHTSLLGDVERTREVAGFCLESAQAGDPESLQVAREGISNAHSFILQQKQAAVDCRPVARRRLVEGLAAAFCENSRTIEEGRLGLLAHLARQRGRRLLRQAVLLAFAHLRADILWLVRTLVGWYQALLVRTGLAVPSAVVPEPVIRREYLGQLLKLGAGAAELPLIYRRLFRLAPLEDPRFLVGRDSEMTALTEARRLWEDGHAVSVLVVGARGSGKTSLLNCVTRGILADLPLVMGHFQERVCSPAALESFLASLLQVPPHQLGQALSDGRRVIVLEEVERTFLRVIGGFEGLLSLLTWVTRTSRNTMWILSMNQTAYRYLHAAVGLGEHFSHRINAMSVSQEDLRTAVLIRHNLSGLRLQFAQPAAAAADGSRIRRFIGLEKDAEQVFFDRLYRQSGGVFRSGFELWQESIERVEGGVLYMMQPAEPDFAPMVSSLTLQDAFTLKAVMQHGSLTPEELARIFNMELDRSRACLDNLIWRQILEHDPRSPGIRVSPEAGRLAREILHRQNLI